MCTKPQEKVNIKKKGAKSSSHFKPYLKILTLTL